MQMSVKSSMKKCPWRKMSTWRRHHCRRRRCRRCRRCRRRCRRHRQEVPNFNFRSQFRAKTQK